MAMAIEEQAGVPEAEPAQLVINKLTNHQLSSNWELVTGDLKDEFFVTIDDPDAGSNTIQYMSQADYNRLREQGKLFDWQYYATPGLGSDPADIDELMNDCVQRVKDDIRSEDNEFAGGNQFGDLDSLNQEEIGQDQLSDAQVFLRVGDELRKIDFDVLYNSIVNRIYREGWFGEQQAEMGEAIGFNMSLRQCYQALSDYGFPSPAAAAQVSETASRVRHINASGSGERVFSDALYVKQAQVQWTVSLPAGVDSIIVQYTPCTGVIDYASDVFKSGSALAQKFDKWWNDGVTSSGRSGAWHGNTRVYNHNAKSDLVKLIVGMQHEVKVQDGDQFIPLEQYRIDHLQKYPLLTDRMNLQITVKSLVTSSVPHQNIWFADNHSKAEIEDIIAQRKWTTEYGWKRLASSDVSTIASNIALNNAVGDAFASKAKLVSKVGTWFGLSVWKAQQRQP